MNNLSIIPQPWLSLYALVITLIFIAGILYAFPIKSRKNQKEIKRLKDLENLTLREAYKARAHDNLVDAFEALEKIQGYEHYLPLLNQMTIKLIEAESNKIILNYQEYKQILSVKESLQYLINDLDNIMHKKHHKLKGSLLPYMTSLIFLRSSIERAFYYQEHRPFQEEYMERQGYEYSPANPDAFKEGDEPFDKPESIHNK